MAGGRRPARLRGYHLRRVTAWRPAPALQTDLMPATPYVQATWREIVACGADVEALLARTHVALTMGGEPTFVPTEPTGAEWQTAALGPTKLAYARHLARQLITTAFPGAVVI